MNEKLEALEEAIRRECAAESAISRLVEARTAADAEWQRARRNTAACRAALEE